MYSMYAAWYVRYGVSVFVFFQAEDGIRDLVRSRGLGDVYKRQLGSRRACPMRIRLSANSFATMSSCTVV